MDGHPTGPRQRTGGQNPAYRPTHRHPHRDCSVSPASDAVLPPKIVAAHYRWLRPVVRRPLASWSASWQAGLVLIEVSYGRSTWTALVEVKTRDNTLGAGQVNAYWDIARDQRFDTVITIANEIAPAPGVHPTAGLHVRSNRAPRSITCRGRRSCRHGDGQGPPRGRRPPNRRGSSASLSATSNTTSPGPSHSMTWARTGCRSEETPTTGRCKETSAAAGDLAIRRDQLMRYTALSPGAEIGEDVQQVFRRGQKDPDKPMRALIDQLCDHATLDGVSGCPTPPATSNCTST